MRIKKARFTPTCSILLRRYRRDAWLLKRRPAVTNENRPVAKVIDTIYTELSRGASSKIELTGFARNSPKDADIMPTTMIMTRSRREIDGIPTSSFAKLLFS